MKIIENYFSEEDKIKLVEAIREAELLTSGEIRVFYERHTKGDTPENRAIRGFKKLGMNKTKLHNGVLFYLAFDDRKYAVIGDKGIHDHVHQEFWDELSHILHTHFANEQFVEGLVKAIAEVGNRLQQYFPIHKDDINELPDEIYFEED